MLEADAYLQVGQGNYAIVISDDGKYVATIYDAETEQVVPGLSRNTRNEGWETSVCIALSDIVLYEARLALERGEIG